MSKFFTRTPALLLACVLPALASDPMPVSPPLPALELPVTAGPSLPKTLDAGRFAALAKKSPFTLASTTEENADFAKDLILAGYVRIDGQDFVMIANRNRPERLMVGTKSSPSAQGLVLVKVERDPSGDPTKLRAQIRKGSETAMLRYEAGASSPSAPVAPVPAGMPGQPPIPQASSMPVGLPGQTQPQTPPVVRRRATPIPSAPAR